MNSRLKTSVLAVTLVAGLSASTDQLKTSVYTEQPLRVVAGESASSLEKTIVSQREKICRDNPSDEQIQIICSERKLVDDYIRKGDFNKATETLCLIITDSKRVKDTCALNLQIMEFNRLINKGETPKAMDIACGGKMKYLNQDLLVICDRRDIFFSELKVNGKRLAPVRMKKDDSYLLD